VRRHGGGGRGEERDVAPIFRFFQLAKHAISREFGSLCIVRRRVGGLIRPSWPRGRANQRDRQLRIGISELRPAVFEHLADVRA
jgi:hypothetical protein